MPKLRKDCSNEDLNLPEEKNRRHPKSLRSASYREKEIKVVRALTKEVAGPAFQSELQKFKNQDTLLLDRRVICKSDRVEVKFSNPLRDIEGHYYVKKWKCEDMVSPDCSEECDQAQTASVVAVKLNWRKGVKVEQVSNYSRQKKLVEPSMTTTEYDYESKLKFQKQLETDVKSLFPNVGRLSILDGNESRGRITIKSSPVDEIAEDEGLPQPTDTFEDKEEHQILLVPTYSKTGFDSDVTKRYSFPYAVKFCVNKKVFEHKFMLRLLPSATPQHFGLIFTFPGESRSKVIIKTLLSVFSVFPSSPKHATLQTYSNSDEGRTEAKPGKSGYKGQFVKNLKESVMTNLEERKVVNGSAVGSWDRQKEFTIGCNINHPHQRFLGIQPKQWDRDQKQKGKSELEQAIRAEVRETY